MPRGFVFNSESVTEGHPDKLCDQISDAVVDHLLAQDPCARVRAECAVSGAIVFLACRFRSTGNVDFARVARKVIARVGYNLPEFSPQTCNILTSPRALPPEDDAASADEAAAARKSCHEGRVNPTQVTLFGYACADTPALLPYPIWLAHQLTQRLTKVRQSGEIRDLSPDAKVQAGIFYEDHLPRRIHSITVNAHIQKEAPADEKKLSRRIRERVIEPVLAPLALTIDTDSRITVNPEGFYQGGPVHHSGLTGRKNAIDTYGEFSRHSGKALSGKDPMRIDRCGAYAARHAAKNMVAAGLAGRCEIMLSYSIGRSEPVSVTLESFGTGSLPDDALLELVRRHFDFKLGSILDDFDLCHLPARRPDGFYQHLASYGHFGREELDLPWERLDRVEILKAAGAG
jgi:S-adenosylmethionine synthetase